MTGSRKPWLRPSFHIQMVLSAQAFALAASLLGPGNAFQAVTAWGLLSKIMPETVAGLAFAYYGIANAITARFGSVNTNAVALLAGVMIWAALSVTTCISVWTGLGIMSGSGLFYGALAGGCIAALHLISQER